MNWKPKILIMVLSSTKEPYNKLMRAQKDTWDSIDCNNVKTIYYYSEHTPDGVSSADRRDLPVDCSDDYNMMHWKFKKALDIVWIDDWDYIFKTNSSSYINKELLYEKILTLPAWGVYCGIDGGGFASGSGAIISRDVAVHLKHDLTSDIHGAEDVCIGQILEKNGVKVTKGAERYDFNRVDQEITKAYHYRCIIDKNDRDKDIEIFKHLFSENR